MVAAAIAPAASFGSEMASIEPRKRKLVALSCAGKLQRGEKNSGPSYQIVQKCADFPVLPTQPKDQVHDNQLQQQFTSHFIPRVAALTTGPLAACGAQSPDTYNGCDESPSELQTAPTPKVPEPSHPIDNTAHPESHTQSAPAAP